MSEDYSAAAERIVNATNLADDDLSTFEDDVRTVALGYLAQAVRIKELEAENERLTRYAATQAASKRTWQQISENTADEHDETLARVKEMEAALESVADATMADGLLCWCLNDGYWDGEHTETCLKARTALAGGRSDTDA